MSDYLQVFTTTDRRETADEIARQLVERRLAACVHVVGPVQSTYRWQGKIETAQEWTCVAKTRRDRYRQLEDAIAQLHNYDVPEIVAVRIEAGSSSYLDWIGAQLDRDTSA